ncbi:MAG: 50S ribosomal protein L18Ae [Candidatus Nanohaloarchaeota archaeon QJJ-5]|nr:50S ribosomal protein L18Ae [Candidatus Nanohaloarchaeota archaeon QJJ-5]
MSFNASGTIDLGKETQPFEREVDAESEDHARELIYSQLGSEHGISRANIEIESVESV